jgi:hypothetical protein
MSFGLLRGLNQSDVVGVATDALSTDTQKELSARVKAESDAKALAPTGPEMSMNDRVRLGVVPPDYSDGTAPANAAQFTRAVPIKG